MALAGSAAVLEDVLKVLFQGRRKTLRHSLRYRVAPALCPVQATSVPRSFSPTRTASARAQEPSAGRARDAPRADRHRSAAAARGADHSAVVPAGRPLSAARLGQNDLSYGKTAGKGWQGPARAGEGWQGLARAGEGWQGPARAGEGWRGRRRTRPILHTTRVPSARAPTAASTRPPRGFCARPLRGLYAPTRRPAPRLPVRLSRPNTLREERDTERGNNKERKSKVRSEGVGERVTIEHRD